jgi:hypothetical protein
MKRRLGMAVLWLAVAAVADEAPSDGVGAAEARSGQARDSAAAAGEGKRLLWGDTHLHTYHSFDAFALGNTTAGPETAFRYAMGLPVIHPFHRARVRIGTPLDFLVVSDHAEYLGVIRHVYEQGVQTENLGWIDTVKAKVATWTLRRAIDGEAALGKFAGSLPQPQDPAAGAVVLRQRGSALPWLPPLPQVECDAWADTVRTADAFNRPGEFTAMLGWEWSSTPGGANLHRVVITDSGASAALLYQPFSFLNSPYPEDLWVWLDLTSARTGADFVAIPHNPNLSKGYMFSDETLRGEPLSAEYVAARRRWERVAEITQIKGDSETHPALSPDDPFADFETYPYYLQSEVTPYVAGEGDYLRPALRRGLALAQTLGENPFQLGLIGSSDAHTGLASAEEDNFHGKLGRDSIPENKRATWGGGGASGWSMSASGLAAVWAGENTREAIFAAIKRREVYATSGPRIAVQFFAGWEYGEELLQVADLYAAAAAAGVPMGGEISGAAGRAPRFVVRALKDPLGANLDRVQIVKGWSDRAGRTQEAVYDIAWSGERAPDERGRVPAVGSSVDVARASYQNSIGAAELSALWQDPAFDPEQPAFYYARVLQIPTPRHSLYDALALGLDHAEGYPDTIQERAYTSPIWYLSPGR